MDRPQLESAVIRYNVAEGRLEARVAGQIAYAEYRLQPGTITFTHTRVPETFGGRGIGTQLIEAGLSMARDRGLKLIAQCPFFAAYIQTHPDTQDLLATPLRP